jgi:hypothetical protein
MDSDELKRQLGIDDDGTYRVDPETGKVQKEGAAGGPILILELTLKAARFRSPAFSDGKTQRLELIQTQASFKKMVSSGREIRTLG